MTAPPEIGPEPRSVWGEIVMAAWVRGIRAAWEAAAEFRGMEVVMAGGRKNLGAERLTAEECDRRAVEALRAAGHQGLEAASVGAAIWRDRKLDRRGFGFAAVKVLERLARRGVVRFQFGEFNRTWYLR